MKLTYEGNSTFEDVNRMTREVMDIISHLPGLSDKRTLFKINIVLRELLNNAVEHGNGMDSEKRIVLGINCDGDKLEFIVEDEGPDFSMREVLEEASRKPLERTRMRGLALVKDLGFYLETDDGRVRAGFYIDQ